MTVARGLAVGLLVAAVGTPALAQELKLWRHGVIEPKGDAGFMLMVGQRDFGAKHDANATTVKALEALVIRHDLILEPEFNGSGRSAYVARKRP